MSDFYNSKGLKIVHQNIRGLLVNLPLLEIFISTTKPEIDIICICETHIQDFDSNEKLYALPGHRFVHKPRKSGKGGSFGIYVRNTKLQTQTTHTQSYRKPLD